jgi:hypothetical protein
MMSYAARPSGPGRPGKQAIRTSPGCPPNVSRIDYREVVDGPEVARGLAANVSLNGVTPPTT